MRVTQGRAATLTLVLDDEDGNLVNADSTPSVSIVAGDGVTSVSTSGSVTSPGTGVYVVTLPRQTQLDRLTATWSSVIGGVARTDTQTVDVVGSQRLMTLPYMKDDSTLAKLSAQQLMLLLDEVESNFASIIGFPAVQEGMRVDWTERRFSGRPSFMLGLGQGGFIGGAGINDRLRVPGMTHPRAVYSISVDTQPFSGPDLALIQTSFGSLVWEGKSWYSGHYQLWAAHGLSVPPADLRRAALTCARYIARGLPKADSKVNGGLPERIASLTTEGATILFSMPSEDRPTGLPDVDTVLVRYRRDSFV